jgi:hypothetical protein
MFLKNQSKLFRFISSENRFRIPGFKIKSSEWYKSFSDSYRSSGTFYTAKGMKHITVIILEFLRYKQYQFFLSM